MYSILMHPMMYNLGASDRARQLRDGCLFCSADLPKLMLVVACYSPVAATDIVFPIISPSSIVTLHRDSMERIQLFRSDAVLLKVCTAARIT
jgi:hypothetical protein